MSNPVQTPAALSFLAAAALASVLAAPQRSHEMDIHLARAICATGKVSMVSEGYRSEVAVPALAETLVARDAREAAALAAFWARGLGRSCL